MHAAAAKPGSHPFRSEVRVVLSPVPGRSGDVWSPTPPSARPTSYPVAGQRGSKQSTGRVRPDWFSRPVDARPSSLFSSPVHVLPFHRTRLLHSFVTSHTRTGLYRTLSVPCSPSVNSTASKGGTRSRSDPSAQYSTVKNDKGLTSLTHCLTRQPAVPQLINTNTQTPWLPLSPPLSRPLSSHPPRPSSPQDPLPSSQRWAAETHEQA